MAEYSLLLPVDLAVTDWYGPGIVRSLTSDLDHHYFRDIDTNIYTHQQEEARPCPFSEYDHDDVPCSYSFPYLNTATISRAPGITE